MEARKTATSRSAQDPIAMLKADHQRVHALRAQFERASDGSDDVDRKQRLAERICQELEVHAQLEEELFYPAVRAAIGDDDLMDEAQVEHQSARDLIRQIRSMSPGDALYDAKVKVLGEYVDHHVREEEGGMFPKAKKARVDLADLARRMAERRATLESEHSMEPFDLISSMLMRPIRAAASAVRAGASAGTGRKAAASGARRSRTTR
jgi:hemerythrin superfamily protein